MSAQSAKEVIDIDPEGQEQSTKVERLLTAPRQWDKVRYMMLLSTQISMGNKGRLHGFSRDEVLAEYGWGAIFMT